MPSLVRPMDAKVKRRALRGPSLLADVVARAFHGRADVLIGFARLPLRIAGRIVHGRAQTVGPFAYRIARRVQAPVDPVARPVDRGADVAATRAAGMCQIVGRKDERMVGTE